MQSYTTFSKYDPGILPKLFQLTIHPIHSQELTYAISNNAVTMNLLSSELDLTPNPRREIGEKIIQIGNSLFESVKSAPPSLRSGFPNVLRNNNFALAVRVTKNYAFLEVTTKARAPKSREMHRSAVYRQFFTSKSSSRRAAFAIDRSRLCRFSEISIKGTHVFSLGSDFSICVSDARCITISGGRTVSSAIDVVYVVGFGDQIREDEAWQEFDALIRITLADWSAGR